MKNTLFNLLSIFRPAANKETFWTDIKFQRIPVVYSNSFIKGIEIVRADRFIYETREIEVERKEQTKIWNVAVNTVEPEDRFNSHNSWMLYILAQHALVSALVGEYENKEMLEKAEIYKAGLKVKAGKSILVSETKNP